VLARLVERELTAPLVRRNNALVRFANTTAFIPLHEEQEAAILKLAGEPRGARPLAIAEALPHPRSPCVRSSPSISCEFDQDATDHNLPLSSATRPPRTPGCRPHRLRARQPHPEGYPAHRSSACRGADKTPAALNELLANAARMPDGQAEIIAGVADALEGWRKAPKPAAWEAFVATLPKADLAAQDKARQLNVIFGDGQALDEIRKIALDAKALMEQRRAALLSLIEAKDQQLKQVLRKAHLRQRREHGGHPRPHPVRSGWRRPAHHRPLPAALSA
jgi:hypothetical protein